MQRKRATSAPTSSVSAGRSRSSRCGIPLPFRHPVRGRLPSGWPSPSRRSHRRSSRERTGSPPSSSQKRSRRFVPRRHSSVIRGRATRLTFSPTRRRCWLGVPNISRWLQVRNAYFRVCDSSARALRMKRPSVKRLPNAVGARKPSVRQPSFASGSKARRLPASSRRKKPNVSVSRFSRETPRFRASSKRTGDEESRPSPASMSFEQITRRRSHAQEALRKSTCSAASSRTSSSP